MRTLLLAAVAAAGGWAQDQALMEANRALAHYERMIQLMEATTSVVPGLARAAAPVLENTRQALVNLRAAASTQDATLHYAFQTNARAYLALADALPKPHPFPQEGRRQFSELRDAIDRANSHFQALLELKEAQLRSPDRDNLRRYAEANSVVPPPAPGKTRVVFLGDSITDGWRLNEYFPDRDYLNRGISGQTTGQMLGRMQADVVALKPAVMVLLGGTNDLARGTSLSTIQDNLTMITTLALANNIKPVIASILPVHDYHRDRNPAFERTRFRSMESIRALNQWIAGMCKARGAIYLDYFTPMLDAAGFLQKDLADDGLHPNAAGYRLMAPLAQAAIDHAVTPASAPKKERRRFPF